MVPNGAGPGTVLIRSTDHPAIGVVSAGAPVPLFNVWITPWTTDDDFPAFSTALATLVGQA
jgi:hypothetical protein